MVLPLLSFPLMRFADYLRRDSGGAELGTLSSPGYVPPRTHDTLDVDAGHEVGGIALGLRGMFPAFGDEAYFDAPPPVPS
jgi:hypothetical protein